MTKLAFERPGKPAFEAVLGRVVAEGGGGVVQEARRTDGSDQTFIVKRARAGGEALLEYERRTCEQVEHPCLVRYLGVSNPEGLGPLLAFEALAADPLLALNGAAMRPKWRDPGTPYYPLPPNRALELAFDLLLGLEHLHERGLVHADVKLSNLLARVPEGLDAASLLQAVAEGRFTGVLIDMGSVRQVAVLEALTRGHADVTLIPSITPLYAPPEALFESSDTGGRKVFSPVMDTYAFGLVFWALLTGRIPYSHLANPDKLKATEVVMDLKNREQRGTASPIDLRALSRIRLHDVGFEGSAISVWPAFHGTTKELLLRCLEPDPKKRIEAKDARALFQEGYRFRYVGDAGSRAWVQGMFQMRPRSNRLLRDAPLGGIRIREDKQNEVFVEEAPPPRSSLAPRERVDAEDGSTISFRSDARRASGRLKAPPAPKGMTYLADVLREVKAKRPLPLTPPVIVTRTGFAPTELVKCMLFPLEGARDHVKISDDAQAPLSHKHRVNVGRGDDNDIVMIDAGVSKHHLYFEKGPDGGWWVVDNNSSNGTFLDETELQKGGRVRLSRGFATIGLGLTAKLTYMTGPELGNYLEKALEVWAQAFAGKASGRLPKVDAEGTLLQRGERGSSTEVEAATPLTPAASPRATTRRQRRDDLMPSLPPAVQVPTPGARPRPLALTREDLAKKLAELTDVGSFAVHFEDARVEDCDTASEVLELLAESAEVLGVDAMLNSGKKLVLFRKSGVITD